ncbi:hypothetical protein NTE_03260 [Candidatus Nitrososphaera evergladensis SR1]|uniref:Uncharacterized protein n=1 Tax=Candidatus Nitrososphaera evergladensis SR1 TaxID=1459636 RepID=A0A075N1E3_9ARCH|nr:hypothetical protein [Candidatus Nitrososphaera evergladensis]AIF85289.1 hypothetical protein NTE_03260 [Candidatus Nitrososphaera evergladensis SR1]
MNYFQRGTLISEPAQRLSTGYIILTLGVLMAISGGTWDVTNHLLNKPETFFSPPHAVLYSGAGTAVFGAVLVLSASRAVKKTEWPARLAIAGVTLLLVAGPVDFWWHSLFGLDGLLSPPHAVLVSGMVTSGIGAMIGIIYAWPRIDNSSSNRRTLPKALLVLGMLPVWLAAAGSIDMFSLPFSDTGFFHFNPQPWAGAILAMLGFPLITAAIMVATFSLAGRKFGVASALAGTFVFVSAMTSIVPNEALWPTIPFYVSVMVPLVAVDATLSHWRSKSAIFAAGAIAGLAFFVLYYPLITHTFNEVVMPDRAVWASLTGIIYFEMVQTVFPLVAVPSAAMGILGAIIGQRMATRAELALLK